MGPSRKTSTTDFPWWLVVLGLAGAYAFGQALTSEVHAQVLSVLSQGIGITLLVTVTGFAGASALGLLLAVGGLSRFLVIRQVVKFYIEVIRGIPIIVLLLYVAFAGVPMLVEAWNFLTGPLGLEPVRTRDISLLWRAVTALVLAYSAFLAEVFRAGIVAVDPGQIEAAKALGLNGWLRFRLIVAPQAFRTILPPYGNDFIAMVKDSSLVSVLGVTDVTQLGKVTAAGNFRYFETYNLVALIYLTLTVTLSLGLSRLERHLRQSKD
ncbi:amino acid ABC transporter permease [Pannonibacter sp.]|uniref:amino acid ABC transporter permease n=1 Tax=Pannonibacter sp. TaxID=1906786 RepID=UPI003F717E86